MSQPPLDVLEQLTLSDIASWQVSNKAKDQPKMLATLPALQRGAVWKPRQIENLWDSLMRGFPVGSFLVAPYGAGDLGSQVMQHALGQDGRHYTHYLLDGQQRATAIALGFVDPTEDDPSALLWLDLHPETGKADDREFVFRVITRFHPWGFSRTNAESRLEARKIREAFEAFKLAATKSEENGKLQEATPSEFPLKHAWPWDAIAPVPVAFLWNAEKPEDLLKSLERLPYWNSEKPPKWKTLVQSAIEGDAQEDAQGLANRLKEVLKRFRELEGYEVPVLTVAMDAKTPEDKNSTSEERPDHIETLFVRVNSGGTPLEGEELIYSILKSEWPDAPRFIEGLAHRLASPARTVVLAARLILARIQKDQGRIDRQPPVPDVTLFRRLLRGAEKASYPDFKKKLDSVLFQGTGTRAFDAVHRFLTMDEPSESGGQRDYRLHPYLAADLARGSGGHEIMILLLRWADRLSEFNSDPNSLDEDTHRRTLGFITALAWFGLDARECVSRLWKDLQTCEGVEALQGFFNAERFQRLIRRDKGQGVILIPPVPAEVFSQSLDELYSVIKKKAWADTNSRYWKGTDFYRNYNKNALNRWVTEVIYPLWDEEQREEVDAWWIDRIWADRRFLIYAQRGWLKQWFRDYDPTVPGAADTNRPWDYDHIHPNSHIYGQWYLPAFLKRLHGSNGNFRAWPMEANRSDQDLAPEFKLRVPTPHERRYGLASDEALRAASFIKEGEELKLWRKSVPAEGRNKNYLSSSDNRKYKDNHLALVRAITLRLGAIYAEWFDNLKVGDLLPKTRQGGSGGDNRPWMDSLRADTES